MRASGQSGCFRRMPSRVSFSDKQAHLVFLVVGGLQLFHESYSCHVNTGSGARYVENQIDFLAAYIVPLDVWYIVPAAVAVNNRCVIILSPHLPTSKHARYREAWHLLREKRRGSGEL